MANTVEASLVIIAVAASLLGVLACAIGVVLAHRAIRRRRIGKELLVTSPHGIDEQRFVRIGGIDQWIGIRGQDRRNPAILVLHGGPGCSYSIFAARLLAWEKHFTIVQWDQRGAGKTLGRNGRDGCGAITMSRMVDDAIEVAEHVRETLGQRKIIVLSSSMGTLIGLPLVKKRPDLVAAYVGTDLNVGRWSDQEMHEATIERLRRAGLRREADRLVRLGPDPARWTAREWSKSGEWVTRSDPRQNRAIMRLLLGGMWFSPMHDLAELRHLTAGMTFTTERLFPEFLSFDARALGLDFEIPFFVFQGAEDLHTPTRFALDYFDAVRAPVKGSSLIENAGHFAAFLEPQRFLDELLSQVRPVVLRDHELAA